MYEIVVYDKKANKVRKKYKYTYLIHLIIKSYESNKEEKEVLNKLFQLKIK